MTNENPSDTPLNHAPWCTDSNDNALCWLDGWDD